MFKDSKIVICGVGNVGATTAYTIVNQGLCEQLVLIDINKDKAYAEALDMSHAIHFMNRNMKKSHCQLKSFLMKTQCQYI